MTLQRVVQVDAFTDRPFAGNPAAVCVLEQPIADELMAAIAAEMNLAETAFLQRLPGTEEWSLRWFTPEVEVDLCGHATLASAHALWESGKAREDQRIHFHTRSGILTAERRNGWIELDFPALPSRPEPMPGWLAGAIGAEPVAFERSRFDLVVEVADEATVRNLRPNLARLGEEPVRGFIVTARGTGEHDFVSRFFGPAAGVMEDPVTGSAHSVLGPYWAERLGRTDFTAFQASRRGGVLRVSVRGDRVLLAGQAVTTLRGELILA
ncbi:MAG TPA: PhzF family phenazine biosynthesis protein [Gemmatimonadales bacterium]